MFRAQRTPRDDRCNYPRRRLAIVDPALRHVWRLGDGVRLAVPHCDPTVNLYDSYHVFAGDTLEAIWPVTARGRSR
jgi:3-hydroxy-D-aspartate aldolase